MGPSEISGQRLEPIDPASREPSASSIARLAETSDQRTEPHQRKASRNSLGPPWLLAIAPAMTLFVQVLAPLLTPKHAFLYHARGSVSLVIVAMLVNVLVTWLVFVLGFTLARRSARFRAIFLSTLAVVLPCVLARNLAVVHGIRLSPYTSKLCVLVIGLLLLGEFLLWRSWIAPRFERFAQALEFTLAVASVFWMFTLTQLCWFGYKTHSLDRSFTPKAGIPRTGLPNVGALAAMQAPHRASKARVIWILLDELSYAQVYEHRPSGLALPAFDALASTANVFTHAASPGLYTEQVLPALLLGQRAQNVRFSVAGDLSYQNASGLPWQSIQPTNTVFGDASRDGYTTGIAGWHNPYCRLLAPVLNQCTWTSRLDSVTPDFDTEASLTSNVLGPIRHLERCIASEGHGGCERLWNDQQNSLHIEDLSRLLKATDLMLRKSGPDLLLLHLPIPHPDGIYDRRRGVLTSTTGSSSYVDNLALADRVLAHLCDTLKTNDEWDGATVLVMGDHGWRTQMLWKGNPGWTPEDETASSGGRFDPRPAYILKLPSEHSGNIISTPFETVNTRDLLDRIMQGTLHTEADLQTWLAKQIPARSSPAGQWRKSPIHPAS